MVVPYVSAGSGFLLAVLWFDLMHDVLVIGKSGTRLPGETLTTISRYYRRVTTDARPMNRLVAAVMLGTLAALVVEVARDSTPTWASATSLGLTISAVVLAAARTVPNAVRLGTERDSVEDRSRLARSICHQHLGCFAAMAAVLALQLAAGG